MRMEAETRRWLYKPRNAKDCQDPSEARREAENIDGPKPHRSSQSCQPLDFELLTSRSMED